MSKSDERRREAVGGEKTRRDPTGPDRNRLKAMAALLPAILVLVMAVAAWAGNPYPKTGSESDRDLIGKHEKAINNLYDSTVGVVSMYTGSVAPAGYLMCDGSCVSRTTYADLYLVTSTTYSTCDGSTTFGLPDFRGIFPKGAGTTTRAAGVDAAGKAYAGTLGAYTQDRMQGHKVRYYLATGGATGAHANTYSGTSSEQAGYTLKTDGTNGTPRQGSTTEPQSVGINFIIKY